MSKEGKTDDHHFVSVSKLIALIILVGIITAALTEGVSTYYNDQKELDSLQIEKLKLEIELKKIQLGNDH